MTLSNFLDTNCWLALFWSRHSDSAKVTAWLNKAAGERFFFCRFTQLAVLRLLTNSSVMGADVKNVRQAWEVWDRGAEDERIAFIAEPDDLERELRRHSNLPSVSPKIWADAYLLAFASAAGLRLVTSDRALKGRGADVIVL